MELVRRLYMEVPAFLTLAQKQRVSVWQVLGYWLFFYDRVLAHDGRSGRLHRSIRLETIASTIGPNLDFWQQALELGLLVQTEQGLRVAHWTKLYSRTGQRRLAAEVYDLPIESQGSPLDMGETILEFLIRDNGVWILTKPRLDAYAVAYPRLAILEECRKAQQWCQDNPAKRKTKNGMPRFLNAWLAKANRALPQDKDLVVDGRKQKILDQQNKRQQDTQPDRISGLFSVKRSSGGVSTPGGSDPQSAGSGRSASLGSQ